MAYALCRIVAFISIFTMIHLGSEAEARCIHLSKEDFIRDIPIFLKGYVRESKIKARNFGEDIELTVDVIALIKGSLSKDQIYIKYFWAEAKEPIRKFKKGFIYIFAVEKMNGAVATVSTSTCDPEVSEKDLAKK